ncbi:MAG: lysophospholipase [Bryobacter sp.]|jgi:hypothetical protein|nr:lysophospholipase [Bryobacter sp.]
MDRARMTFYLVLLGMFVAAWAYLVWFARKNTYYPYRYPLGDWSAKERLAAEDVWPVPGLHGWWLPHPTAQVATLYLHGNGGNVTFYEPMLAAIRDSGSSVLIIDYRGYGRSEGTPSEAGLVDDAEAGYRWLRERYPAERIIVHGLSLGTSIAVQLAVRAPCRGVTLEAPFSSARAVAHSVVPFLGWTMPLGYDTDRHIRSLRRPVLFLHGDRDRVIPLALGQALFAAASEPKRFQLFAGAGHDNVATLDKEKFTRVLRSFHKY